ncbi:protein kinase [Candidatus Uabimicrobium sp. HlEnr_7]|uniref:protein kinase domain-containing protein n=1 Tax=Candidatus Uabimicrobium helgolandensis TaxID=3095367 RepID=UPI0035570507
MENKDILFAKKVLELHLIDKQHLKNCYVIQQQSAEQGKTISLSQIAVHLGFMTQQHVDMVEKLLLEQINPSTLDKTQTGFQGNSIPNGSALFTNSMIGIHERSIMNTNDKFNRYIIEEKLGEGGMGAVYRVRDDQLRRSIALKVIIGSGALNQKQIQRFMNEARATASLKHPNIVEVYEIGTEPQNYFTMELIKGRSLSSLMRSKNLSPHKTAIIMIKCSEALHYAHKKGIIHRDIKPSNIMMENNQEPKIMDFGLAKDVGNDEELSNTGDVLGTLTYMSPEQANGKDVDPRSDVYALGASLYEVLSKRPPFQGESSMNLLCQIFAQEPVELRLLNPDIPRDLEAICLKCLHKKPEKRYQTAKELTKDLNNFIHNRPVNAQPITTWIRFQKNVRRNKTFFIFLALFFVALTIGVSSYIFVTKQARERAVIAKQEAEKLMEAEEIARKAAEKATAIAEQATKAEKIARKDTEEALYRANIILADVYNSKNQMADVSNVLAQAKKNKPDAENFWEYRWQKNRGHFEVDHYLSKLNNNKQVIDIAVSRNGYIVIAYRKMVVLGSINKKISQTELWSRANFNCCTISQNGMWVAAGDIKGNVYILNTSTLEKITIPVALKVASNDKVRFPYYEQQVEELSFNKDGTKLLVARQTINYLASLKPRFLQSLLLIDVVQKKITKTFSTPKAYQSINSQNGISGEIVNANFTSCHLDKNAKNILGATEDGYVYAFHFDQVRFFGPHQNRIQQCATHPKNSRIIASASGYNLYFWDQNIWNPNLRKKVLSQKYIEKIRLNSRISSFQFNANGQKLAVSLDSGEIYVYPITVVNKKSKVLLKIEKPKVLAGHAVVKACAFSAKGDIFSGGDGVKFWPEKIYPKTIRKSLPYPSRVAAFHPKQDILVFGQPGGIILVNSLSGKKISRNGSTRLAGHFSGVTHAQFSKKGHLYTSGFDGAIILWDIEKFKRVRTYHVNNLPIERFVLVNNEKRIIAVGNNGRVYSLDISEDGTISNKKIYKINDLKNLNPNLVRLEYSDNPKNFKNISWNGKDLVAVTGQGKWLYLIDTKTMALQSRLNIENKQRYRKCLLFYDAQTDDNYVFLARSNKITKHKINGNTLQHIATFIGHTRQPLYMIKDINDARMISCGKDGSIHFWPLSAKATQLKKNKDIQINSYFALKTIGVLNFCAFDSKNNKIVTSGGDDGTHLGTNNSFFHIWDAATSLEKK